MVASRVKNLDLSRISQFMSDEMWISSSAIVKPIFVASFFKIQSMPKCSPGNLKRRLSPFFGFLRVSQPYFFIPSASRHHQQAPSVPYFLSAPLVLLLFRGWFCHLNSSHSSIVFISLSAAFRHHDHNMIIISSFLSARLSFSLSPSPACARLKHFFSTLHQPGLLC